jgi:DNA-binding protein H-NS
MSIDLAELSLTELHDLIAHAQQALSVKQKQARKEVIAEIHALAASVGITVVIQEAGKTVSKKPVAAKYCNPWNPTQTWSGRGMQPRWLVALLKEGTALQECLI